MARPSSLTEVGGPEERERAKAAAFRSADEEDVVVVSAGLLDLAAALALLAATPRLARAAVVGCVVAMVREDCM